MPIKKLEEIPTEEWDRVMAVNVRGPFECVEAVVPIMRRQRYGKIVKIASGTLTVRIFPIAGVAGARRIR